MEAVCQFEIQVRPEAVDGNGHVNNVVYVQWMQEAAVRHAEATGCSHATQVDGATWVARSHWIEYLRPAYAGDHVRAMTWVVNFRKVRSLRKYQFVRVSDHQVLAQGETEWVYIDTATGHPKSIPDTVIACFPFMPNPPAPNHDH